MRVAYVAGPYRDARGPFYMEQNIRAAEAVAIELWRMGFAVICPHANTRMFDGAAPDEVWLNGDLEILRRCDLVVMVGDWTESSGAVAEKREAIRKGIEVYDWELGSHRLELQEIAKCE